MIKYTAGRDQNHHKATVHLTEWYFLFCDMSWPTCSNNQIESDCNIHNIDKTDIIHVPNNFLSNNSLIPNNSPKTFLKNANKNSFLTLQDFYKH